jgi:hypothetical protein
MGYGVVGGDLINLEYVGVFGNERSTLDIILIIQKFLINPMGLNCK